MKRIGLVGEAPSDVNSIANLLSKYNGSVQFLILLRNLRGSELDNPKTKRLLRIEYESEKPDRVIFIRDLYSVEGKDDYERKSRERKKYFTVCNQIVDRKGIFLLNIYELEALILADINKFNSRYNTDVVFDEDPTLCIEPKEFLKDQSGGKYNQSDNPDLFKLLDIEVVAKRCHYFGRFLKKLNKFVAH